MTVGDLIEIADVDALEITVREHGCGLWVYQYRIGKTVQLGKYDHLVQKDGTFKECGKFIVPEKPTEFCRIDGRCRGIVIPKDINKLPKNVLELKIHHFRPMWILGCRDRGLEIDCYEYGYKEPENPIMERRLNGDTKQMSLFDTDERSSKE